MGNTRATDAFVCFILGTLLIAFLLSVGIPTSHLIFYGVLLVFETWALLHRGDGDTISEGFWRIASFPLVPWMCAFLFRDAIARGILTNQYEIGALAAIQAHLFWQSYQIYKRFRG